MNQTDLLAEFETKKKSSLYSKLSIAAFLIAATLVSYTFATMSTMSLSQTPDRYLYRKAIGIIMVVCSVVGVVLSIFSLIKREKPVYLKIIGVTLNALLFLFLVTAVVFASMMDSR